MCEDAMQSLSRLKKEFGLTIQEIDITLDHELHKKYFDKIPVLVIDNHTTVAAPIHIEKVRSALMKAN